MKHYGPTEQSINLIGIASGWVSVCPLLGQFNCWSSGLLENRLLDQRRSQLHYKTFRSTPTAAWTPSSIHNAWLIAFALSLMD